VVWEGRGRCDAGVQEDSRVADHDGSAQRPQQAVGGSAPADARDLEQVANSSAPKAGRSVGLADRLLEAVAAAMRIWSPMLWPRLSLTA